MDRAAAVEVVAAAAEEEVAAVVVVEVVAAAAQCRAVTPLPRKKRFSSRIASPFCARADQIIQQLDVQPAQVLIEAVILYVTHNHSQELGVNFGVVDSAGQVLGLVGDGAAINGAGRLLAGYRHRQRSAQRARRHRRQQ